MSNKTNSLSSEDPGASSIKDDDLSDDSSAWKEKARKVINPGSNYTDIDGGISDFKMHEVDWENLEVKLKEAQIEMYNQVCFNNTFIFSSIIVFSCLFEFICDPKKNTKKILFTFN